MPQVLKQPVAILASPALATHVIMAKSIAMPFGHHDF